MDKKEKHYSLGKIKSKKAIYNMIIGERSNGKTYSVLEESLKQWIKTKKQMAYVRRWKEDVIGKRASQVWYGLNSNGRVKELTNGQYEAVTYKNGKFFVCNYDKEGKPFYNESEDCIGYTFALSDSEHDKSTNYEDVTTIVFDEFLTRQLYLVDEFVTFMNVLSTIIRRRTDVTIYMLGNTVNKFSPYFKEMGIKHINQMEQGTIDVYKYGEQGLTVAVEYCSDLSKQKKNNFYFAFDNPKLNMITGGAWELDIYPHLPMKYKPKDIKFTYYIEFNELTFTCEVIRVDNTWFTYIHEKTTELLRKSKDLIYTLDKRPELMYNSNIMKPMNKLQERLYWFFIHDRVYYQNNEVGDTVANYLKYCKRG